MLSKLHKQNTNFQIAYFLAGSCHTPDGAYSLLKELREERQAAIGNYKVQELKNKAKEIRANKLLQGDEAERLEGEAELLELENNKKTGEVLYQAALDEVAFIDKCLAVIEPLRIYKDLPDGEANEMAQRDEWKFELMRRAENYLLTTGGIPTDQFDTMRLHPDFKAEILPRINEVRQMLLTEGGRESALEQIEGARFQEIIKLLPIQNK
jgi:hypothetical protein